jgi:hypothetical protein
MNNEFDNQEATNATPLDDLEEFEVEISDLPPERGSHFLLAGLRGKRHTHTSIPFINTEAAPKVRARVQPDEADDFEIEFSDLPPSERSHFLLLRLTALSEHLRASLVDSKHAQSRGGAKAGLARLTRAQRRAGMGRVLTALGVCAAVLLLLAGNAPSLRTQLVGLFVPSPPTPTPLIADTSNLFPSSGGVHITVRHSGLVPIETQNSLGPLPATCPKADTLQTFESPLDPPGLGEDPVWLVGFSGPTASLVHLRPAQPRWLGWYQTLTLFVEKGYASTLVLQGGGQRDGTPLWFGDENMSNIDNSVYIDLRHPAAGQHFLTTGQWEFMPVNIFVPAAGCYFLQVNWSGGSWMANFAAGHL